MTNHGLGRRDAIPCPINVSIVYEEKCYRFASARYVGSDGPQDGLRVASDAWCSAWFERVLRGCLPSKVGTSMGQNRKPRSKMNASCGPLGVLFL